MGGSLKHLPALRRIGFPANRRLLDVQTITHDCALGEAALRQVTEPVAVDDQRAAGLRYGQARVQARMAALLGFTLPLCGFTQRQLRERRAPLLGLSLDALSPGRMTYDLRRLRLHGLLERLPRSHRYRLTRRGLTTALFFTRSHARVLRAGTAQLSPPEWAGATPLRRALDSVLKGIDGFVAEAKLSPYNLTQTNHNPEDKDASTAVCLRAISLHRRGPWALCPTSGQHAGKAR